MSQVFHLILKLDLNTLKIFFFLFTKAWKNKMNFLRKWESAHKNTSTLHIHSHFLGGMNEGHLCAMLPFPPVLKKTLSGGSALPDSRHHRTGGPCSIFSIKGEMHEKPWRLHASVHAIVHFHLLTWGFCGGSSFVLCNRPAESQLCLQEGRQQGSAKSGWVGSRSMGFSFQMHAARPSSSLPNQLLDWEQPAGSDGDTKMAL